MVPYPLPVILAPQTRKYLRQQKIFIASVLLYIRALILLCGLKLFFSPCTGENFCNFCNRKKGVIKMMNIKYNYILVANLQYLFHLFIAYWLHCFTLIVTAFAGHEARGRGGCGPCPSQTAGGSLLWARRGRGEGLRRPAARTGTWRPACSPPLCTLTTVNLFI